MTDNGRAHLSQIENATKSLNPGYPFTFRFTDDEHQEQFKKNFGVEQLADIFSVMASLISCLGLFGLASFLVEKRTKEISIRKVLGASPAGLWLSLSTEMLKPVCPGFHRGNPARGHGLVGSAGCHRLPYPPLLVDLRARRRRRRGHSTGDGQATMAYGRPRINPARALQTE